MPPTPPRWPFNIYETPINEIPVAVLDFETTGLNGEKDQVVEVAVVRVDPGKKTKLVLNTLVNPEIPIPEQATVHHGIIDKDVAGAPLLKNVMAHISDALAGSILATYGLKFDSAFLARGCRLSNEEYGTSLAVPSGLCLLNFQRVFLPGERFRNLGKICELYDIPLVGAHTAAGDAETSAALWVRYREMLEEKGVRYYSEILGIGGHMSILDNLKGEFMPKAAEKPSTPLKPRNTRRPRRIPG